MKSTRKKRMQYNKSAAPRSNRKPKSRGIVNTLKIFLIFILVVGIVGAASVWIYVNSIISKLDPIDPDMVSEQLYESSVIVDSSGKVLEYIQSDGLRKIVKYGDISQNVIDAFIAVEDKTFETHNGFNVIRLFGAARDYLFRGRALQGTSTISQQLARNVYLFDRRSERTLDRKITEAHYTMELEKYLSKEQIMEGYLNLIYFGMRAYGVEAAANTYFSKKASELDYIEAAILAGIVKGPSYYAPMIILWKSDVPEDAYVLDDSDQLYTTVFNEKCINRYKTCLYLMRENKKITEQQYKDAIDFDIKTKLNPSKIKDTAITSYFGDIVKKEVVQDMMERYKYSRAEAYEILHSRGLKIECTIDLNMQKTLETHYERDNFNSYFGNTLKIAVNTLKSTLNLEQDGIADRPVLDKIADELGLDPGVFTQDSYKSGMNHEDIVLLKSSLFKLGFFVTSDVFPSIRINVDKFGNLLNRYTRKLIQFKRDYLFDEGGNYIIREGEYNYDPSGNLVLMKGAALNFYSHYKEGKLNRIQITIKDTYDFPKGFDDSNIKSGAFTVDSIYMYSGRDVLIPDEFKRYNDRHDVVISRKFLEDNPNFFKVGPDGSLLIPKDNFVEGSIPVVQPQSASVIIDYRTGHLKAIVGGRNIEGSLLFNRATAPRQPGSAIKPIAVYTPAIDSGKYTAGSVIDDRPVYLAGNDKVRWPLNWYETYGGRVAYRGLVTLREAVELSMNVPAAVVAKDLGEEMIVSYLEKFGVTTIVKEGPVNDMNVSALSLGGMSLGISPLQMAQSFGTIANGGMKNPTTSYTRVTNNRGQVLLEKSNVPEFVIDKKAAYIMTSILKSTVDHGLSSKARLDAGNNVIPVAGKTGTTSQNMDAWFVGYSPYYVGATWFGSDINIPLSMGSEFSARFWSSVMKDIHAGKEPAKFEMPDGIHYVSIDKYSGKLPGPLSDKDPRGSAIISEMFIRGTAPTEEDDVHVEERVCKATGLLVDDRWPEELTETRVFIKRPEPYDPEEHEGILLLDTAYDLPTKHCDEGEGEGILTTYLYSESKKYVGVTPTTTLSTGSSMVNRPYPVQMLDGSVMILKPGSIIQASGNIILPNGETVLNQNIYRIQHYTTEELDEYFRITERGPTDPGSSWTDGERPDAGQDDQDGQENQNTTQDSEGGDNTGGEPTDPDE